MVLDVRLEIMSLYDDIFVSFGWWFDFIQFDIIV